MKVENIEVLYCDAGWRPWIFLKIETDDGLIGWSEITDSHGSPHGLKGIIKDLSPLLIGKDPRATERVFWDLYRQTRQSPGGLVQKALGGIENALLDIKAKSLGIPVYELFGGPIRDDILLYWSHCGTTRARAWEVTGTNKLKSYEDVADLGREVVARGFSALKTNVVLPGEHPSVFMPGFQGGSGSTDQVASPEIIRALKDLVAAFRSGTGDEIDIMLDLNFNFKPEGCIRIAKELESFNLCWLEIACFDAVALADLRRSIAQAVCSGENLYTNRAFRPYFEARSMDIVSVDVIWNGFRQAVKIAEMAESYELNVAPHNYYSHLATFISAHFCATVPNVRVLETDVDDVPWKDELVTSVPNIEKGRMLLPTLPGWGTEIDERVLRRHLWPSNN